MFDLDLKSVDKLLIEETKGETALLTELKNQVINNWSQSLNKPISKFENDNSSSIIIRDVKIKDLMYPNIEVEINIKTPEQLQIENQEDEDFISQNDLSIIEKPTKRKRVN